VLAEFCDDRVVAGSPTSATPADEWREWELELVDGPAQLFSAAEPLFAEAGAQPSEAPSKLARTVAATLPEPHSWRSRRELDKNPTSVEALSAYLAEHLIRLEDEDSALRAGDQEGVHQLRVAARRLRSALATYRPVLQPDATTALRADLKWLGAELARARDAQVLRQRLDDALTAQPDDLVLGPVRARLDTILAEKYTSGRATADAALNSERYFELLDRLELFVDDPPTDDAGRRPARGVVPDLVAKELKRVRKRHRAYTNADPDRQDPALHEVRKAAKRLRYAAETARPVFGKRAKRLAARARDVQKVLGEHQDTVVARPVLREIGARAHLTGENGFTFGRLHGLEQGHAAALKRAYPDAMSRLLAKKLTRVWE
jgi:CHAD domain-containing protein